MPFAAKNKNVSPALSKQRCTVKRRRFVRIRDLEWKWTWQKPSRWLLAVIKSNFSHTRALAIIVSLLAQFDSNCSSPFFPRHTAQLFLCGCSRSGQSECRTGANEPNLNQGTTPGACGHCSPGYIGLRNAPLYIQKTIAGALGYKLHTLRALINRVYYSPCVPS